MAPVCSSSPDAAGMDQVRVALHANRSFLGVDVFVQLATFEPPAQRGFTLSAPLRLSLGS